MTRRSDLRLTALLVVVGALLVGASLVTGLGQAHEAFLASPGVVVTAVLLIAVGEILLVRMPSGRVLAPVSTAAVLTVATLGTVHSAPTFDVSPAVVVLIIAIGQLVAVLVHREWVPVAGALGRLVGGALTAMIVRATPVNGLTLWEWQADDATPRWQVALGLLVVAGVGLVVERFLAAGLRAAQLHKSLLTSLGDELEEAFPFTSALVAPAPIATLTAPAMGVVAMPLALMPVVLTLIAVQRYAAVGLTFRQTIRTLSRLTEEGGYTPRHHAQRTAELARAIGQRLDLSERDVRELEYAALLHDLGQVTLRAPIPYGATVLAAPGDQRSIARTGATIIRHGTDLDRVADLVEHQSTPYRAVVELEEDVPVASRILKVANAFDDHTRGRRDEGSMTSALERIHLGLGYEYDPAVVAALEAVMERHLRDGEPGPVPGGSREQSMPRG